MAGEVEREAQRRRTFAVISHPDAGKSTLTEALALHTRLVQQAGAIHGKAGRAATVSDWMEMEMTRGISITSAALTLSHRDCVLQLVDTPGHADFSEDTYRVLSAVDAAIMLIDAAKGLEPQTLKLFQVCRYRKIPVITVVNKWDRPGRDALELLDEIQHRIGITPTPLTWPVGIAGDLQGMVDVSTGEMIRFTRTAGGATIAQQERLSPAEAQAQHGEAWTQAVEEVELLEASGQVHTQASFLGGETSPTLFAAAVLNIGVAQLLDVLVEVAPPPPPREDVSGAPRPVDSPFSAVVFKVQSGMDRQHRDRLAYARVCSGRFERGQVCIHAQSGKPFHTKYATSVVGRERQTLEEAYPGDVIGLVNASMLRPGDTLYADEPVTYPPLPSFAPEHFSVCRAVDSSRYKQFQRGIEQLSQEGVVQVLVSDLRGAQAPVLAAVGPMQFEVVSHRMEHEFSSPVQLSPLEYSLVRETTREWAQRLDRESGVEVLERVSDRALLVLIAGKWRLQRLERDLPNAVLTPLVAASD